MAEAGRNGARVLGIDLTLLVEALSRTPAQRITDLVATNRLAHRIQQRTLTAAERERIQQSELEQKWGELLDLDG